MTQGRVGAGEEPALARTGALEAPWPPGLSALLPPLPAPGPSSSRQLISPRTDPLRLQLPRARPLFRHAPDAHLPSMFPGTNVTVGMRWHQEHVRFGPPSGFPREREL